MTDESAIKILEQYREKPTLINEIKTVEEAVWLNEAITLGIKALKQESTVQDKQAESEKYQKAYDDGYDNGYAQARFDYEQEPCPEQILWERDIAIQQLKDLGYGLGEKPRECDDCVSREAVINTIMPYCSDDDGSTENLDDLRNVLDDIESLPSVYPQNTEKRNTSFINKPCISIGVCHEDKIKVLDKIWAEIKQLRNFRAENYDLEQYCDCFDARIIFRDEVLDIIDKHRKEEE